MQLLTMPLFWPPSSIISFSHLLICTLITLHHFIEHVWRPAVFASSATTCLVCFIVLAFASAALVRRIRYYRTRVLLLTSSLRFSATMLCTIPGCTVHAAYCHSLLFVFAPRLSPLAWLSFLFFLYCNGVQLQLDCNRANCIGVDVPEACPWLDGE